MAFFSEGYDVDVVQEVSSDLFCVICLKLMRNPVQFKCGHGMCFNCYKNLLAKVKNKTVKELQCPQCREVIRDNQIFSNVMLHRLILSLQVFCSNENIGCRWIGEVSQIEDHLSVCPKNPDASSVRKPMASSHRRKTSNGLPQPHNQQPHNHDSQQQQQSIVFTMLDGISTLRNKIEYLENNLSPQNQQQHNHSSTTPSSSCQSCNNASTASGANKRGEASVGRKRSRRSQSESFTPSLSNSNHLSTWWASIMEYFEVNGNHAVHLKVAFLIVLISIYAMTAKLFYTIENNHSYAAASSGSSAAACENRAFGFAMRNMEKSTQTLENGFRKMIAFHEYNARVHLHELQLQERDTAAMVPSFYRELNRTIVEIDQRFDWIIHRSRDEITRNVTWFDERSLRELSIDNVAILVHAVNSITNEVWRRVNEEISFTEFAMLRRAGRLFEKVRQKYLSVLENAQFSLRETSLSSKQQEDQSKKVELSAEVLTMYESFVQNVTQRLTGFHEDQIKGLVRADLVKVRQFYDQHLRAYYANVSQSATHQARFQFLVDAVANKNMKSGRFLWQLNATRIQAVDRSKEVFYSTEFQSGSASTARLYMYRDRVRKGFWKVAFVQTEERPVKIWLSVVSQVKPELLLLHADIVGSVLVPLSRSKRTKVKIVKHFSVSMNTTELITKGYIASGKVFIRCLTSD